MQSVSSKIWTRVAVSISYEDNHYTTGISYSRLLLLLCSCIVTIFLPLSSLKVDILTFIHPVWYPCLQSPIFLFHFSIHNHYHIILNLFLCQYLKISLFRLFNNWPVTLYLIILIFFYWQRLHLLLKFSAVENFWINFHFICGVRPPF